MTNFVNLITRAASRSGAILAATLVLAPIAAPAHAQPYTYATTITAAGSTPLSYPGAAAIDTAHNRLFIADSGNNTVQVFDTATFAYVATIGQAGAGASDNAHFNGPTGVAVDAANKHLLVTEFFNARVQVLDLNSFAYIATIGTTGVTGSDNAHFNQPLAIAVDGKDGEIFVADAANARVQVFNSSSLSYIATMGAGADGVAYNPSTNQVITAGRSQILIFDVASLSQQTAIGQITPGGSQFDDAHLQPSGVTYDAVTGLILASDTPNFRVQGFNALSGAYATTLGTTASPGSANSQFSLPGAAAADPVHNLLFVPDASNQRVQVFTITPSPLHSSVLPGGRSVQVGTRSTVFASIINGGMTDLANCLISLPSSAPAGLTMDYQTTNPTTNALSGTQNAPVSIAAGTTKTFILGFQSTAALTASAMPLNYSCDNTSEAGVIAGVNSVDLIFSTTPIADVIALSLTPSGDGIAKMAVAGTGFFALASINIGAQATLTVAPDFGGVSLPATATICETNSTTGACLATPSSSVTIADTTNDIPTFTVFVAASGAIPFSPGVNRVFVRFVDANNVSHGSTNVAVMTN